VGRKAFYLVIYLYIEMSIERDTRPKLLQVEEKAKALAIGTTIFCTESFGKLDSIVDRNESDWE
jgi:hypothetical protein